MEETQATAIIAYPYLSFPAYDMLGWASEIIPERETKRKQQSNEFSFHASRF